jgi:redox-sensitive bicupin YhaK (pirin superfamily)
MSTGSRTSGGIGSIQVLRSGERGHFDHGWLNTYHSFSFSDYYDPSRMHFRSLRVINEDWVAPGMGFGTHPHRDMEILTYVLEGTLVHGDSLGHGGPIRAGELQRITAGSGLTHSERNGSDSEPVHLYQIWLFPDRKGLTPDYEQRAFDATARQGRWQLVASRDGRDGSLTIHQDASISLARLAGSEQVAVEITTDRHGWLQVMRGGVSLDGTSLGAGDAAMVAGGSGFTIEGEGESEVMLFDLA